MRLLLLFIYAVVAQPQCRWLCDDPVCSANCWAKCAEPNCVYNCSRTDIPECRVYCPAANNTLCSDSCPACETKCEPVTGCDILCEAPSCGWQTSKGQCRRPQCELMCERPACAYEDVVSPARRLSLF